MNVGNILLWLVIAFYPFFQVNFHFRLLDALQSFDVNFFVVLGSRINRGLHGRTYEWSSDKNPSVRSSQHIVRRFEFGAVVFIVAANVG